MGEAVHVKRQKICGRSLYIQLNFTVSLNLSKENVFFKNSFYIHSYQKRKACHTTGATQESTRIGHEAEREEEIGQETIVFSTGNNE